MKTIKEVQKEFWETHEELIPKNYFAKSDMSSDRIFQKKDKEYREILSKTFKAFITGLIEDEVISDKLAILLILNMEEFLK